jgi:hypothetical protein
MKHGEFLGKSQTFCIGKAFDALASYNLVNVAKRSELTGLRRSVIQVERAAKERDYWLQY